jgi:hypothetical protein
MDKISIIYQRVEPNEEHEESSLNVKVAFELSNNKTSFRITYIISRK